MKRISLSEEDLTRALELAYKDGVVDARIDSRGAMADNRERKHSGELWLSSITRAGIAKTPFVEVDA